MSSVDQDDHLWGAMQIRQAFGVRGPELHLWVELGAPIFLVGRTLHCSRAALMKWLSTERQAKKCQEKKDSES